MTDSQTLGLRAILSKRDRLLVGAALATGVTAQAMDRGGMDFMVVSSAARLRVMGAHPLSAYLPLTDSHAMVAGFGRVEFLSRVRAPVFFGAWVSDPEVNLATRVAEIREWGFAGVINLPGSSALDGRYRQALEERGLGVAREAALLAEARHQGLLALGHASRLDDAKLLASAGADMLCLSFGSHAGGMLSVANNLPFDELTRLARRWIDALRAEHPALACLIDGGPVATPDEMVRVCEAAGADGYIGGSTVGRRPLEVSIKDITSAYKAVAQLARAPGASEDELLAIAQDAGLVCQSREMMEVLRIVSRVARTALPVMITGENGTGKELVARAIHRQSRRADAALVTVNCAALPRDLLESELFGHEAGAFTGATRARIGRFESAHGATLFLDEIGDLEMPLQAKLLRALENGEFHRLGSNVARKADVRLICATNRDLGEMVEAGAFRRDLLYRLNAVRVRIPPLRERVDDIPLLARHIVEAVRTEINPGLRGLDHSVYRLLLAHSWPGNVRELKHVLETAAAMCDRDVIDDRHLPDLRGGTPGAPMRAVREQATPRSERDWILEALARHRFRRADTARALGLSRKTLYNKMRRFGLLQDDS